MTYLGRCLLLVLIAVATLGFGFASSVQKDLDTNPKFKEKGITAKVINSENGYYTIMVKGFGPNLTKAINDGEDFGVIAMFTSTDIGLIAEMEQILKKRPDVKAIKWKAELTEAFKQQQARQQQARQRQEVEQRRQAAVLREQQEARSRAEAARELQAKQDQERRIAAMRKPRLIIAPVGQWSDEFHTAEYTCWSAIGEVSNSLSDSVDVQIKRVGWSGTLEWMDRKNDDEHRTGLRFRSKTGKPENVFVMASAGLGDQRCLTDDEMRAAYKASAPNEAQLRSSMEKQFTFVGGFSCDSANRAADPSSCMYSVELWRDPVAGIVGHVNYPVMEADTPAGLIEQVKYNSSDGTLSFQATLPLGGWDGVHQDHQILEFVGKLTADTLKGTFALRPERKGARGGTEMAVVLKKGNPDSNSEYANITAWQQNYSIPILKFRGPK